MSNFSDNVRKSPFKPFDFIVFGVIALLIGSLFLFYGKRSGDGFEVLTGGEKVFEYSFSDGSYRIYDAAKVSVCGGDVFSFSCDGGSNVLSVDREGLDAYVSFSDCRTGECMKMKLSSGSIICVPHDLVVRLKGKISDPLIG